MSSHYRSMKLAAASAVATAPAFASTTIKPTHKQQLRGQQQQNSGRSLLAAVFLLLLSASVLNSCCIVTAAAEAENAAAGNVATTGKTAEEKESMAAADETDEALMAVKRAAARTYNFGLGKRGSSSTWTGNPSDLLFTKDKLIDFLLRQSAAGVANGNNADSSSFYYPGNSYADNYGLQAVYVPESLGIKRSKPQRFSFGLGKRTATLEEVAQPQAEAPAEELAEEDDANERNKRKAERYQFGLGKRSPFASWFGISGSPKSSRSIDEFKRRYNFGLGK